MSEYSKIIRNKEDMNSNTMEESLRAVRTNIRFCGDDIRVICFTSVLPDEGKSTVVMKLAESFATAGDKVLVIDTDMRKSVLVGRYRYQTSDGKNIIGLSQYLSGQNELKEVIYDTENSNLSILFAGHSVANATELLEKEYFKQLLETARQEFDYILLDCPPMTAAIDATIVAKEADGAILVIAQDNVNARAVADSKNQLEASGVRILGAIMNKVKMQKSSYYGNYYGNYYGSYYGNYGSKKK